MQIVLFYILEAVFCFRVRGIVSLRLLCCSREEYRVIHARPYQGCYMIPNNEVVDSYIVAAIITGQLYVCTHFLVTSVSHSSTKEQKHGTEILHELNHTFWWNVLNRKFKDIKKNLI